MRQKNEREVRGDLTKGIENGGALKRSVASVSNGVQVTWRNALEGVDRPSVTFLIATVAEGVGVALEQTSMTRQILKLRVYMP